MVSVLDQADPGGDIIGGSAEEIAAVLGTFARMGIEHIQLILLPSTLDGIDAFAPVLALLHRDQPS